MTLGQRLVDDSTKVVAGNGTYERNGVICSSLAGYSKLEQLEDGKVGRHTEIISVYIFLALNDIRNIFLIYCHETVILPSLKHKSVCCNISSSLRSYSDSISL